MELKKILKLEESGISEHKLVNLLHATSHQLLWTVE